MTNNDPTASVLDDSVAPGMENIDPGLAAHLFNIPVDLNEGEVPAPIRESLAERSIESLPDPVDIAGSSDSPDIDVGAPSNYDPDQPEGTQKATTDESTSASSQREERDTIDTSKAERDFAGSTGVMLYEFGPFVQLAAKMEASTSALALDDPNEIKFAEAYTAQAKQFLHEAVRKHPGMFGHGQASMDERIAALSDFRNYMEQYHEQIKKMNPMSPADGRNYAQYLDVIRSLAGAESKNAAEIQQIVKDGGWGLLAAGYAYNAISKVFGVKDESLGEKVQKSRAAHLKDQFEKLEEAIGAMESGALGDKTWEERQGTRHAAAARDRLANIDDLLKAAGPAVNSRTVGQRVQMAQSRLDGISLKAKSPLLQGMLGKVMASIRAVLSNIAERLGLKNPTKAAATKAETTVQSPSPAPQ